MSIGIVASIGGLKPGPYMCALMEHLDTTGVRGRVVGYSGSSGGSIWCAMAATGMSGEHMTNHLLSINSKSVYEDWVYGKLGTAIIRMFQKRKLLAGFTGLLAGNKLRQWLYNILGPITFEDCETPLYVTAFDINEARGCLFGPGLHPVPIQVVQAVRGSTAIPMGFRHEPIVVRPDSEKNKVHGYWDGGITACLPISPLTELAHWGVTEKPDYIIALDATGASEPAGREWRSIDDMSILEMLESAVRGLVDDHNSMQFALAKAHNIPVYTLQIRASASMADPGGTILPAYHQAKLDVEEFMNDLWNKNILHF